MSEYNYQYCPSDDDMYCYSGSRVLKNVFGIQDAQRLALVEREITGLKIVQLMQKPVNGNFSLTHIQKIHKFIFSDIYVWAGKIRQGEFLTKGDTIFCRGSFIEQYAQGIHAKLQKDRYLRNTTKEAFVEKLAYYMGEINALHPFREGNGRTARVYFSQLALYAGYDLNFSCLEKEDLLKADIAAFDKNYLPLHSLLHQAVTLKSAKQ